MPGKRAHLLSGTFPRGTSLSSGHSVSTGPSILSQQRHIRVSWVTLQHETLLITRGTGYRATVSFSFRVCVCVKSASAWANSRTPTDLKQCYDFVLHFLLSVLQKTFRVLMLSEDPVISHPVTQHKTAQNKDVWKAREAFPAKYRRQFSEWNKLSRNHRM